MQNSQYLIQFHEKISKRVSIIVFFSEGAHPFGDNFKRQANILAQDYRYVKDIYF